MNLEEIEKVRGLVGTVHNRLEDERAFVGHVKSDRLSVFQSITNKKIKAIDDYLDEKEKEYNSAVELLAKKTDELIESIEADREKVNITPEDLIYKG